MSAPIPQAEFRIGTGDAPSVKRPWSPEELATLIELRAVRGWDSPSIAKAMGRTARSIRCKIDLEDIRLPHSRQRGDGQPETHIHRDTILRAFNEGVPIRTVANQLGLDARNVGNVYAQFSKTLRKQPMRQIREGEYLGAKEMVAIVAPICGVTPVAILSGLRMRSAVLARMAVAKALRDRGISLTVIGNALGGRDHSTIVNLCDRFPEYVKLYPVLQQAYHAIKSAEADAMKRRAA